ncbi:MAG: VWA domain-containing protein [Ktedonobacteraceae bacterium]|nr:VWA domain-containing protein [Ktedonobacteraceae bacterium]
MELATDPIDVVISFDTTGSMSSVLAQVRHKIKQTVERLMGELPDIRIGIIVHGDYCDADSTYVTRHLDLTQDTVSITDFVEHTPATGGGDAPECYELVLHEAQELAWRPDAKRVLVMIGDAVPHEPEDNPQHLNWRTEVAALADRGISIYAVQALKNRSAMAFYREMAATSSGCHLSLGQFSEITAMLIAICYRQHTDIKLLAYEQELQREGRMSRSLKRAFTTMKGRDTAIEAGPVELRAVSAGRFQMLEVEEPEAIKAFVQRNGLVFKTGKGFCEFKRTETIQAGKEIILQHLATGEFFTGSQARVMLGLPLGETARIRPVRLDDRLDDYRVFIQNKSHNRKLRGGTHLLYEVAGATLDVAA